MSLRMKEIFVYYGGCQWVPKDIERVRVHPSVKVIERKAFVDCQKLKYVQFCDGAVLEQIGEDAFRGCISLESVRMAPATRYIGNAAFSACTKLRYVILNEGLYMIGRHAFENCDSMEFLEFPSTTRYIHSRAFRNCQALKEVLLNEGLLYVGANAFELCTNLKAVTVLPSTTTNNTKIKFGIGSKKWIRQWPVKDEQFWNLVATNADLADMANMAQYGMLMPTDVDHVQEIMEELETRHAQVQKYEQGLKASLECWKKTYFLPLQQAAQRKSSLQVTVVANNKHQVEAMELEDDISHGVQAMAIDSVGKKRKSTRAPRSTQSHALAGYSNHHQPRKQHLRQGNAATTTQQGQKGMMSTNKTHHVKNHHHHPPTVPAVQALARYSNHHQPRKQHLHQDHGDIITITRQGQKAMMVSNKTHHPPAVSAPTTTTTSRNNENNSLPPPPLYRTKWKVNLDKYLIQQESQENHDCRAAAAKTTTTKTNHHHHDASLRRKVMPMQDSTNHH